MSKAIIYPEAVGEGDTVAVVAPSWQGPSLFPHRLEQGIRAMERHWNVRVRVAPHVYARARSSAGTPEQRAAELHALFEDPEVRAIWAAIGGETSNRLLPLLDWGLITANPKVFIGYSDITVLLLAMHQRTGLVTFHGPMVMSELAEYPDVLPYTAYHAWRAISVPRPPGALKPARMWTQALVSWEAEAPPRERRMQVSGGWRWLREGSAIGRLMGGNLTALVSLAETPFWPDWAGAILFWEETEESLASVERMLMHLRLAGVFDLIRGMVVGRPAYLQGESEEGTLAEVVLDVTAGYAFPILAEVDLGHTDPMLTLPIGVKAALDSSKDLFAIDEAAVRPAGTPVPVAAAARAAQEALLEREDLTGELPDRAAARLLRWAEARLQALGEEADVAVARRQVKRIARLVARYGQEDLEPVLVELLAFLDEAGV